MDLRFILKCLVGGFAFGIGLMAATWLLYGFVMQSAMESALEQASDGTITSIELSDSGWIDASEAEVVSSIVPPPDDSESYLGSTGIFSEGFSSAGKVLAAGPGEIIGAVTANGEPVAGVKLRLALTGGARSQWATSDDAGRYAVSVPHGKYEVGGFELDERAADRALPGLILHPHSWHDAAPFVVSEGSPGRGIDLAFVSPVIKLTSGATFAPDDTEIMIEWEPYPGAASYSVTLWEKSQPQTYDTDSVFDYRERPSTSEARLDLSAFSDRLKPGHYYTFEIEAQSASGETLSGTRWSHRSRYDFMIEE